MIRPAEPAPYQIAKDKLTAIPHTIALEAGGGSGRVIEVSGQGKAKLADLSILGPAAYKLGDDYSAIATMDAHGPGITATDVAVRGLHVAYRGCGGRRQNICLNRGIIDGANIGDTQLWCFGILGRIAGHLIVNGTEFARGGSAREPVNGDGGKNQCHRIYIGTSTSLLLDGVTMHDNIAGRDVQVYGDAPDPDTGKIAQPEFWHIRNSTFGAHRLAGYTSIQSNPLRTSVIENTTIRNDYRCIEAHGDVIMRGGSLSGAGAGIYCMKDGGRIELDGVDTSQCALPVDRASAKNVVVVRK